MDFLYWSQVQEQLTAHYLQTGETYSFAQAIRDLRQQERYASAPALPLVSFADWDIADLDDLDTRLNRIPVSLDPLLADHFIPADPSTAKYSTILNVLPHRFAHHQALGIHAFDCLELTYVIRGKAQLITQSGSHIIRENSICLVAAHTMHDTIVEPGSIVFSISVMVNTVEHILARLFQQDNLISELLLSGLVHHNTGYLLFSIPDPSPVLILVRGLLHEAYGIPNSSQGNVNFSLSARADYLELLLIHLLRLNSSYERHTAMTEDRGHLPILAILQHIQREYRTTSLKETASLFHFEESYLSRQIKAHTGKTYTQLITDLRIAEAKRLLQYTDHPLEQVAKTCGYGSSDHFSRIFRSAEGVRPSVWRSNARNGKHKP